MSPILACACVGEHVPRHHAETQGIVKFAMGQQSGIGGDPRAMELKLQTAVENEPERAVDRFTRWVLYGGLVRSSLGY
jgi:hypothetical protein